MPSICWIVHPELYLRHMSRQCSWVHRSFWEERGGGGGGGGGEGVLGFSLLSHNVLLCLHLLFLSEPFICFKSPFQNPLSAPSLSAEPSVFVVVGQNHSSASLTVKTILASLFLWEPFCFFSFCENPSVSSLSVRTLLFLLFLWEPFCFFSFCENPSVSSLSVRTLLFLLFLSEPFCFFSFCENPSVSSLSVRTLLFLIFLSEPPSYPTDLPFVVVAVEVGLVFIVEMLLCVCDNTNIVGRDAAATVANHSVWSSSSVEAADWQCLSVLLLTIIVADTCNFTVNASLSAV